MEKIEFPCIDCITLAICKAITEESKRQHKINPIRRRLSIVSLLSKCQLLEDYIANYVWSLKIDDHTSQKNIKEVFYFFKI